MRKIEIKARHHWDKVTAQMPKIFAEDFWKDHPVQIMLFISLVVLLSAWIVAFLRFQPSDFETPLRYDSFLGVTRLGNWYDLYRIPLTATVSFVLNIFLGINTYKKDKMLGYIFAGTTIFIAVLALIVVINFGILLK